MKKLIELERANNSVVEPRRTIPIEGEYDVVVVGAGPAGIGAAISAARQGMKTLLVEMWSCAGGLATLGLVNIPMDFVSGIGAEMFERLTAVNGLRNRHSDPEKHKLILDRMLKDAGVDVLYLTYVVEAIVENNTICGVVVESKSGRQAILAKRVIDCSGDGDAAVFAGCDYMQGRVSDGYCAM